MLRQIFRTVTLALIRRYLRGQSVQVLRGGDRLALAAFDSVEYAADGQYIVTLLQFVPSLTPGGLQSVRIERLKVPYPAISWRKDMEAFVAQID